MNLYKLSQDVNNQYDTYNACVVVAPSDECARLIHPSGSTKGYDTETWAPAYMVKCALVGKAAKHLVFGEVFRAG